VSRSRSPLRLAAFAALAGGLGVGFAVWTGNEAADAVADRWLEELAARSVADPEAHRDSAIDGLAFELKPGGPYGFSAGHDWGDEPRLVTINEFGFRDDRRQEAKEPGVVRIGCLGGSNTYGAAVSDGRTWPRLLERELESRGQRVEVWNLGVSGYETSNKVAMARHVAERYDFDLLVWQLHNMGPRFILSGSSAASQVQRDPSLVDDWVRQPGNALAVDDRMANLGTRGLGRLLRMAVERSARDEEQTGRPPGHLLLFHWARGLHALEAFVQGEGCGRHHLLFVPPPGLQLESDDARAALAAVELPLVDLTESSGRQNGPVFGIHPGVEGYRRYVGPLADGVLAALAAPPPCTN
jgi:hypothetical protein